LIEIASNRLKLIPLDHYLLEIWRTDGRNAMENILKLNKSNWEVDDLYEAETHDALQNFWIPQTILNPIDFFWFTNWEIVLIDQNLSIGGIGFAGSPHNGSTSIGYMIDKKFQNKGYATEALGCLVAWAFLDPSLKKILADTPKDNFASHKVLSKNRFIQIGEGIAEHTQTLEVFNWEKEKSE
jgi:[ribosomal protein S5]-alanine N-acetyltransferase